MCASSQLLPDSSIFVGFRAAGSLSTWVQRDVTSALALWLTGSLATCRVPDRPGGGGEKKSLYSDDLNLVSNLEGSY